MSDSFVAGYDYSPIIRLIKDILEERYLYGFPILKELLQNADDAKSRHILIDVVSGWPDARDPLFQGPGLLIANDGDFKEEDKGGIRSIRVSPKAGDSTTIGKFGLGLLAVHHLCDAFVVHVVNDTTPWTQVLNPWLDVKGNQTASWGHHVQNHTEYLVKQAGRYYRDQAVILWLPFRRDGLIPVADGGFSTRWPTADEIISKFCRTDDLRVILTALRHLKSIEIRHKDKIHSKVSLEDKPGRLRGPRHTGLFSGKFSQSDSSVFVGREATTKDCHLGELRFCSIHWPKEGDQREEGEQHGAAILLRTNSTRNELTISWAVFQPMEGILERRRLRIKVGGIHLLLHGYFFLDSGRTEIQGIDEQPKYDPATDTLEGRILCESFQDLRNVWNTRLRNTAVLPLIPSLMKDALDKGVVTADEFPHLVTALAQSQLFQDHRISICREYSLVRLLDLSNRSAGRWELICADDQNKIRMVPATLAEDQKRIERLFPGIDRWVKENDLKLCIDRLASLTAQEMCYSPYEFRSLFAQLSPKAFQSDSIANFLIDFLSEAANGELRDLVWHDLVRTFREAMIDRSRLADRQNIQKLLKSDYVPTDKLFALPVEQRKVLRAMAQQKDTDILPVSAKLLSDTHRNSAPSENCLRLILKALDPLILKALDPLIQERIAEASKAALEFLKFHDVLSLTEKKIFHPIRIIRARDPVKRKTVVLSFQKLDMLSRKGLLFQGVGSDQYLRTLVDAIPDTKPLVLVDHQDLGKSANRQALLHLVGNAELFGPDVARASMVKVLLDDGGPSDVSQDDITSFRMLCAGHGGAGNPHAHLWDATEWTKLRRVIDSVIGHGEYIVASPILKILTAADELLKPEQKWQPRLRIERLNRQTLQEMVYNRADRLRDIRLKDTEWIALRDVTGDRIRSLPVWDLSEGGTGDAEGRYWEGDNLDIPVSLQDCVNTVNLRRGKIGDVQSKIVDEWTPKAQIRVALEQQDPHLFRSEILEAIGRIDHSEHLEELRDRLYHGKWLAKGVAPKDLLNLPERVEQAAREHFGTCENYITVDSLPADVLKHQGFHYVRKHLFPEQAHSVASLASMIQKVDLEGRLGCADGYPVDDFRKLAQDIDDLKLDGWPLLRAILLSIDNGDVLRAIVCSFTEIADPKTAGLHLDALVEVVTHGGRLTKAAETAFDYGFRAVAGHWTKERKHVVFGHTRVPTRSDVWRNGSKVTARGGHIVPEHVLDDRYERMFREDTLYAGEQAGSLLTKLNGPDYFQKALDQHKKFIGDWEKYQPPKLVAVYLWFAGRDNLAMKPFRKRWIGAINEQQPRLEEIVGPKETGRFKPSYPVVFFVEEAKERSVIVTALSGCKFEAPMRETSALFVDEKSEIKRIGNKDWRFVTIRVRVAELFVTRSPEYVVSIFREFVKSAAKLYFLSADRQQRAHALLRNPVPTNVQDSIRTGSRVESPKLGPLETFVKIVDDVADIGRLTQKETERWLRDELKPLLDGLGLPPGSEAAKYLRVYRDAQGADKSENYTGIKADLWDSMTSSEEAQKEILEAVRGKIRAQGYSVCRVLFELFQNADDAYQERDQRNSQGRFKVYFFDHGFRVVHWGRPINHPGTNPGRGHYHGYDRDLYKMLVMGVSEKYGDSLTGKFGLGFKCVHLMSNSVGIASGLISVRTAGGIIPKLWAEGVTLAGDEKTVIDVPYCTAAHTDGERMRSAFLQSLTWLPVFARCIARIEVCGTVSRDVKFRQCSLSPSIDVVKIKDSKDGTHQAVRLDLGDGYSLLLKIGQEGPECFTDVRRLWFLAPLEEQVDSGWLLNGPFPVLPGRRRLKGTPQDVRELFADRGTVLGERLLELHTLVDGKWKLLAEKLDCNTDSSTFWDGIFTVMNRGINGGPAHWLHEPADSGEVRYRGYGHLLAKKQVLPTHLPIPYNSLVRASCVRWYASGALKDSNTLLKETANWNAARELASRIVSSDVGDVLATLGFNTIEPMTLSMLISREMGSGKYVGVDLGKRLGMVVTRDRIRSGLLFREQRDIVTIASEARFLGQDNKWHAVKDLVSKGSANEDEKQFCEFAPRDVVLSNEYGDYAVRFFELARSWSGYSPRVERMAEWAKVAVGDKRKQAVLRYTIYGLYGSRLVSLLRVDWPNWVSEVLSHRLSHPLLKDFSDDEKKDILLALDRRRILDDAGSLIWNPVRPLPPVAPQSRIIRKIYKWWLCVSERERPAYDRLVYPRQFRNLKIRNDLRRCPISRVGWFTMFALACYQSFGRTQDGQHRSFIENGMDAGWWEKLAQPIADDDRPWRDRLRQWTSPSSDEPSSDEPGQEYLRWKRTLVDLYAIARGLDDFVLLLRKFPRFADENDHVLLDQVLVPGSKLAQDLGIQSAPPINRTLGIGANWLMRELIRNGVYDSDQAPLIARYCWMPSKRVRALLRALGADVNDSAVSERIYDFVVAELDYSRARFDGDYDLPLQIITRSDHSGLLEQWFRESGKDFPDFREDMDSGDHA